VGELRSTVHATDSSAPLSERALEQVVSAVLERLREEAGHERQVRDDARLRSRITAAEGGWGG